VATRAGYARVIDTDGNVRPGRPIGSHEKVEYARVKATVLEYLDMEMPHAEIAARIGIQPGSFHQLMKRILREVLDVNAGQNIAAREFLRIEQQERKLLQHINDLWTWRADEDVIVRAQACEVDIAPLLNSFVNLSKRKADMMGANQPLQVQVEEVGEERAMSIRDDQRNLANALTRFYEIADKVGSQHGGLGSGMTADERDREIAAIAATIPQLGVTTVTDDGDIDDAIVIGEANEDEDDFGFIDLDGDDIEIIGTDLMDLTTLGRRDTAKLFKRIAAGDIDDTETPGRWVKGQFISFWHDEGDDDHGDGPEVDDMWMNTSYDIDE
jgi:hypothetical protein